MLFPSQRINTAVQFSQAGVCGNCSAGLHHGRCACRRLCVLHGLGGLSGATAVHFHGIQLLCHCTAAIPLQQRPVGAAEICCEGKRKTSVLRQIGPEIDETVGSAQMVAPYVSELHRWAEFVLWPLVLDAAAGTAKLLQVCCNYWDCTRSLAPTLLDWRGSCSAASLLINEDLWRRSGLPDVPGTYGMILVAAGAGTQRPRHRRLAFERAAGKRCRSGSRHAGAHRMECDRQRLAARFHDGTCSRTRLLCGFFGLKKMQQHPFMLTRCYCLLSYVARRATSSECPCANRAH